MLTILMLTIKRIQWWLTSWWRLDASWWSQLSSNHSMRMFDHHKPGLELAFCLELALFIMIITISVLMMMMVSLGELPLASRALWEAVVYHVTCTTAFQSARILITWYISHDYRLPSVIIASERAQTRWWWSWSNLRYGPIAGSYVMILYDQNVPHTVVFSRWWWLIDEQNHEHTSSF